MNNGEMVFEDCAYPGTTAWPKTMRSRGGPGIIPPGTDHPGVEEHRHRHRRIRAHRRLRAELRAGRTHPDQAPGGREPAGRHGDQNLRVRGLLRDASRAVDEGSPNADYLCSMAKLFASEEILKVCRHAVELHGGNGTMLDFGIEKLYRDATMFLHMDAPSTSRASRSSKPCSRKRRAITPGRKLKRALWLPRTHPGRSQARRAWTRRQEESVRGRNT